LLRIILHIDMDAFYSSVERRENPELRGNPVIVGADPKGGTGRGVVAGCSYEARKFGVHSAQPISIAYRLCPNGIYLKPDFPLYERVSDLVMGLLRQFTEKLEPMSIDEAFLDVTQKVSDFQEASALAARIKDEMKDKIQLTCSVGVAPNKSIAKIASDFKKPDGLTIVPPERAQMFLAPLPVSKISGVGKKSSEVLEALGIKTIGDLAAAHPSKLTEAFGKYGTRIWQVANGIDDEEVTTSYAIKSISSETTFEEDVTDRGKVRETFDSLIHDVHSRVQSQKILFRTVGIKVRLEDFTTFTRAKTYVRYTHDKAVMEEYVKELFHEFEVSPAKIRLVGVRVANFKRMYADQETILNWATP
jgi:DNA polymerase IV (DinB-like DNA polymerase)